MDKDRFFLLLEKQVRGMTTAEENQQISDMFDRMQLRSLSWEMNEREEQAIQSRIKRRIDARLEEKRGLAVHTFPYWRMVASFVLLVGLGYLFLNQPYQDSFPQIMERMTDERQKAVITLHDGTVVSLNVNSSIRFPAEFEIDSRKVELVGEAFFEVIPDKERPFIVESQGVKTQVLGTSFNVKANADRDVQIMVKTGKVAVFQGEGERQLVLSPNQLASVDPINRQVSVEEVNVDDYMTWRAEQIAFDLVPFSEVISRLGKVYNMDIQVEGIGISDCLIKATYSNRSLYSVLYGLKNLVDFDYEETAKGTMLVRYRRCKD